MTIADLKDLEKVIKLCRKAGVEHIIVDGIELNLGPEPRIERPQRSAKVSTSINDIAQWVNTGIAYTPTEDTQIPTDSLSEEQLLYYSATGNEQ